jgi:murein L,D-transpeptidase YcbB/YkuD
MGRGEVHGRCNPVAAAPLGEDRIDRRERFVKQKFKIGHFAVTMALLPVAALVLLPAAAVAQSDTVESVIRETLPLDQAEHQEDFENAPWQLAMQNRLDMMDRRRASDRARSEHIAAWYEQRNYAPIWIQDGQPTKASEEAIFVLLRADKDGLVPAEYRADVMFPKLDQEGDAGLADFEVSLSEAVALYGQHLRSGRVEPNKINRELVLYPEEISANRMLQHLAEADNLTQTLRDFSPNTPRYDRMRDLLQKLFVARAKGGWTKIPGGDVLKPGMSDPRVPLLRQRLIESKDMEPEAHESDVYDGSLVRALQYFQFRMGLETDGVVGPATLAQLNIDVDERIRQVELNLERRRWMQADFGNPYVFVNLADQVVKVVKDEKTVHAAVTQVGAPYFRTPVFTDQMEYLDFNPYWNVPFSIATKEYLPKLKRNPYALQSQNIRVLRDGNVVNPGQVPWHSYSRSNFPVRLRQDPGPRNALGRVKFMFPNKFNIYIHDTPSKSKFQSAARYFSHGCIRVEDPFKMAEVILGLQGVSRAEIDSISSAGRRKIVKLENPLPVHVVYLTAWVNKDGSIHYRRDVYGRDEILAKALAVGSL